MQRIWHDMIKHLPDYLGLLGILGFSFWGLVYFAYDSFFQSAIAVALGVAFVVWGIVHHHVRADFHSKVVWEYIATAFLGVIILLSLIWK